MIRSQFNSVCYKLAQSVPARPRTFQALLLGLAEVHSDRVHGAGEPWGGAEARSKILRVWVGSGVLEGGHMKVVDGTE